MRVIAGALARRRYDRIAARVQALLVGVIFARALSAVCLVVSALDRLLTDTRHRRFDTLIVWRLDRLGRNLRHLILTLDELTALGVAFVSLNEGIDTTTPAGRLELHILGAIAEF